MDSIWTVLEDMFAVGCERVWFKYRTQIVRVDNAVYRVLAEADLCRERRLQFAALE